MKSAILFFLFILLLSADLNQYITNRSRQQIIIRCNGDDVAKKIKEGFADGYKVTAMTEIFCSACGGSSEYFTIVMEK